MNRLSSSIFKVFPIFTKKLINKVLTTFSLSDKTFPLFFDKTLLVVTILFKKFGLTALQTFLLCDQYCFYFHTLIKQQLFCFLYASLFIF